MDPLGIAADVTSGLDAQIGVDALPGDAEALLQLDVVGPGQEAGEQLRRAREADPGSTEILLLLGDLARAQNKNDEARSQYAACIKALAAKRAWTQRDLNVRVELSLRLFPEGEQRRLAELVGRQATRWLDATPQDFSCRTVSSTASKRPR